jgi:glutamate racemase
LKRHAAAAEAEKQASAEALRRAEEKIRELERKLKVLSLLLLLLLLQSFATLVYAASTCTTYLLFHYYCTRVSRTSHRFHGRHKSSAGAPLNWLQDADARADDAAAKLAVAEQRAEEQLKSATKRASDAEVSLIS